MAIEAARLVTVLETRGDRQTLSALDQVSRAVDVLKGNIAGGFAFAAGFAAFNAGLGAVKAGVEAATSATFEFNSRLQQSAIAFETMLGGGQQAAAFMAQLRQLAIDSAFSLPQVQQGAQRLLAMGFEAGRVVPLLRDIGAASIALAAGPEGIQRITRALGQMRSTGKVMAEDINQLTDVGIPAWDLLAKGIGRTVAETRRLGEQGKISAEVFIQLFQQWSQGRFGGIIDRFTQTWEGATQKIQDLGGQLVSGAFRPLFDWATKLAVQFATWLESPQAARWAAAVRAAVETAIGALQALWAATQPVRDAFARFFDGFADLMGIPRALPQAQAAGQQLGQNLGQGIAAGLAEGNPLDAAIGNLQRSLGHLRIAASDVMDAYTAVIAPLREQAEALAPVVDFQAQLRDLQLDTEASAIREKQARERILDAAKTTITMSGRIRRGKDPTDDLRLLGIQGEQQAAAQAARLAEINRQIALAPILASIAALEAAQKAHLKPIEDQIKAQERQVALLNLAKQAVADLGALATNAGQAVAGIVAPLTGDADRGVGEFGGRVFDLEGIKKRGEQIAGALAGGFKKWWDDNFKPGEWLDAAWNSQPVQGTLTRIKDGLTFAFSPDGFKAFEAWRGSFLDAIGQKINDLKPGITAISYTITRWLIENAPTIARAFLFALKEMAILSIRATTWVMEIGVAIGEGIGRGIGEWLRGHIGEILRLAIFPFPLPGMSPLPPLPTAPPSFGGGSPGPAAESPINVALAPGAVVLKPEMTDAERQAAEKRIGEEIMKQILAAQQAAA